jgi:hypothetical protein
MANGIDPEKMKQDLEAILIKEGVPEKEAKVQAAEEIKSMGVVKIATGQCPMGGVTSMSCMFCPYGHMTECHYPQTCDEAQCSHYEAELRAEGFETEI